MLYLSSQNKDKTTKNYANTYNFVGDSCVSLLSKLNQSICMT